MKSQVLKNIILKTLTTFNLTAVEINKFYNKITILIHFYNFTQIQKNPQIFIHFKLILYEARLRLDKN